MKTTEQKREYYRMYRQKNREQILEKKRRYYLENREQILEKKRQRYAENKERINCRRQKLHKKNKEKAIAVQTECREVTVDDVAHIVDATLQREVVQIDRLIHEYRDFIDTAPERFSEIMQNFINELEEIKKGI